MLLRNVDQQLCVARGNPSFAALAGIVLLLTTTLYCEVSASSGLLVMIPWRIN
jgi:hypothetical protein